MACSFPAMMFCCCVLWLQSTVARGERLPSIASFTVRFWSGRGRAFRANVQTSGRTTCFSTMTTRPLTHHLSFENSWLPKTLQCFPMPLFAWPRPLWLFSIPQDEITVERASFWHDWANPRRIAWGYRWHTFENFQWCMKSWKTCCIALYIPKGTTSKETLETRIYSKKLFLWSNSPNFWVAHRIHRKELETVVTCLKLTWT